MTAITLYGQDRSRYRDFQLGSDLATVSALTKITASEVKTIHRRPAVIQELEWRPPYVLTVALDAMRDPVQRIAFSFYDDQLFRMVVDYDRARTEGLTDGDMIAAIADVYGPMLKSRPATASAASPLETESGMPVARWGDADHAVILYRASYGAAFRLIVRSPRLDTLARRAETQALLLDAREAPQRETARRKQEIEDVRAAEEKARVTNKAAFRP